MGVMAIELLLLAIAAGLSVYLLIRSLSSAALPGCGAGGGCDAVLSSRWGKVGPVPVAGIGLALYLAMGGILLGDSEIVPALEALAVLAIGAAVWFVGLQGLAVKRFCPYCTLVHLCAAMAGGFILYSQHSNVQALIIGAGCIAGLIALQMIFPARTFRLEEGEQQAEAAPAPGAGSPGRMVSLYNGKITLSTDDWPILGRPDAEFVIAKLFDYTCEDCRHLHDMLEHIDQKLKNRLAVLCIPVPLEADCNPGMWPPDLRHVNACHYAKYAMAVWMVEPARFNEFDQWMHQGKTIPSVMAARARAGQLVGGADFSAALASAELAGMIRKAIEIWGLASKGQLPRILLPAAILWGRVPSIKELEDILRKQLDGATAKAPSTA